MSLFQKMKKKFLQHSLPFFLSEQEVVLFVSLKHSE